VPDTLELVRDNAKNYDAKEKYRFEHSVSG